MSKFAAIEARATQYPASTNDVVWLVARARQLRAALVEVLEVYEIQDVRCRRIATAALKALEEPNLPVD